MLQHSYSIEQNNKKVMLLYGYVYLDGEYLCFN